MDREIENRFVRTFLQKRIQDRVIFELASDKKRKTAIYRFCHTAEEIVKPQLIRHKSKKMDSREIMRIAGELSAEQTCYLISSNEEIDGQRTTIAEALSCCLGYGMPSIIVIGEKVAIIETEQENGAACKYVLHAA
jgi:hypothetical protein